MRRVLSLDVDARGWPEVASIIRGSAGGGVGTMAAIPLSGCSVSAVRCAKCGRANVSSCGAITLPDQES